MPIRRGRPWGGLRALTTIVLAAVLMAVLMAGCSANPAPSAARSVTLQANQAAEIDFQGGRYRFTWDAGDCTGFFIRLAPKNGGAPIEVPVNAPTGTIDLDVPAVKAMVERGGTCPGGNHTVTIERL